MKMKAGMNVGSLWLWKRVYMKTKAMMPRMWTSELRREDSWLLPKKWLRLSMRGQMTLA